MSQSHNLLATWPELAPKTVKSFLFFNGVSGADSTLSNSLVKDFVQTTVHVTHTPHARLQHVWVLAEPVVQVVDIVSTSTPTQTLNECWQMEVLQTGPGWGEILATAGHAWWRYLQWMFISNPSSEVRKINASYFWNAENLSSRAKRGWQKLNLPWRMNILPIRDWSHQDIQEPHQWRNVWSICTEYQRRLYTLRCGPESRLC